MVCKGTEVYYSKMAEVVSFLVVSVMLLNHCLAGAHHEDLENFFLSYQRFILQIRQNGASDNPSYVEYFYVHLEGQAQIVLAIFLALDNRAF